MDESKGTQAADSGTVEDLLEQVATLMVSKDSSEPLELWIPKDLTLEGKAVSLDEAMEIVNDAVLANAYVAEGFTESPKGRLYKYIRADSVEEDPDKRAFSLPLTWILLFAAIAGFLIVVYR
ncbi:MAG: hypothetical protein ACE5K1_03380 [Acidiferrobacterales bacterium]